MKKSTKIRGQFARSAVAGATALTLALGMSPAMGASTAGAASTSVAPSAGQTAITASTRFIEANGNRFAYRRFGKPGKLPLVFNQHFTGNLDNWDPVVLDGLAKDREVIIFDNAGIGASTGEVPSTFAGWLRMPRRSSTDSA